MTTEFQNGTKWVRADFHLHTKSDKEFVFDGEESRFITNYVDKLIEEDIKVGVITNHNKFNFGEFKGIKRKAKQNGIIIHPGVELSVKEGSNGIHCLIVFDENHWAKTKDTEKINSFLDEVFKNIDNRENKNTRCNKDLAGVINTLNEYNEHYFIIMAHVEQKSGFFNEISGGLTQSLANNSLIKDKLLGFQKVRTRDQLRKVEEWMGYSIAHLEGSDCKNIEDIGKGKKSYIKIGSDSFAALELSLKDFNNRVSNHYPENNRSYIKSVHFMGGKLDGAKIPFSSELNTLIGIRGSGKSSIIETIRYALGIDASSDEQYKNEIVEHILGSGGKVEVEIVDSENRTYIVSRILHESTNIYLDGEYYDVQLDTIIDTPLYFGQKDLSNIGDNYELNLIKKMVGLDTTRYNNKLEKSISKLADNIKLLIANNQLDDTLNGLETKLNSNTHKINTFEEKGVSEKLEKQIKYQEDNDKILRFLKTINSITTEFNEVFESDYYQDLILSKDITFNSDSISLNDLKSKILEYIELINNSKDYFKSLERKENELKEVYKLFKKDYDGKKEEFASIKREIDIPNLNPDDYEQLKSDERKLKGEVRKAKDSRKQRGNYISNIKSSAAERNELLLDIHNKYKDEIEKINNYQEELDLSIIFKGDKKQFSNELSETFTGSRISKDKYNEISESFSDFSELIIDVLVDNGHKLKKISLTSNQYNYLYEKLELNFESLLQKKTENIIKINYHGSPLSNHSIGQRSSAIILLLLMQTDNDLIIIDQPEDDLDNKVIYEEIITRIKENKKEVQFIFATHNANIPVLGDAEQLISTEYTNNKMNAQFGSVDDINMQINIINIMEGGNEAFDLRNKIYNLWKIKK